ncbi:uncharacterized protein LOC118646668 [Monomorium pharaonis]|uniref:uncharacterized protein LOC118646668 n=1 Tax=Monomorium pharaonis TaxID=307658 RepID=UPI0017479759|nr:uncharacterized protein LOC118646668 [Monomorium pharaonis]
MIAAVKEWPFPHNKKQLRSFLGFCSYYRKFVKGFSSLAKPLYALTENRVPFVWEKNCLLAFEELKRKKFIIRTDHVSLKWLLSFRDLEGQLGRWLEKLQQYEFEVHHRKGLIHKNADGLSRRLCKTNGYGYCSRVEEKNAREKEITIARISLSEGLLENWRKEQREDPTISIFCSAKEAGMRPVRSELADGDVSALIYWSYWDALSLKNGILYRRWTAPDLRSNILQLILPRKFVTQVLKEAYDSSSGGHFGVNKTLERIQKRFFWATCKQDRIKKIGIVGFPCFFWLIGLRNMRLLVFSPAEMYFARDLKLPLDLFRRSPPEFNEDTQFSKDYVGDLRLKLRELHAVVKKRMDIKSSRVKAWYDRKARLVLFQEGQKVWLCDPRRSRGKTPKVQNSWESPYLVIKKLSDVVYCIQKSSRHRKKVGKKKRELESGKSRKLNFGEVFCCWELY